MQFRGSNCQFQLYKNIRQIRIHQFYPWLSLSPTYTLFIFIWIYIYVYLSLFNIGFFLFLSFFYSSVVRVRDHMCNVYRRAMFGDVTWEKFGSKSLIFPWSPNLTTSIFSLSLSLSLYLWILPCISPAIYRSWTNPLVQNGKSFISGKNLSRK